VLTTVNTLKEQIGIPAEENSQDSLFERLIRAATDAIETECRREFEKREYEDTFQLPHDRIKEGLILSGYPVDEILEVKLNEEELLDWEINKRSGFISSKKAKETGELKVKYTAGYILPDPDNNENRDLPYDIEDACIMLALFSYNTSASSGIRTEQADQLRLQFTEEDIPNSVKRVIERHKDWRR